MNFCGDVHCDFIGELRRRHMVHITEQILLQLDFGSIKNARLVSKTWLVAVSDEEKKDIWKNLMKKQNGQTNEELFLLVKRHLEMDFPVPVGDKFYSQRFCNSVHFCIKEISRATSELDFTIDYLPYFFPALAYASRRSTFQNAPWCYFDMNDSYIVTLDWMNSQKMKYWPRRFFSLLPRSIDWDLYHQKMELPPGINYQLFGDRLIAGLAVSKSETSNHWISKHPVISILGLKNIDAFYRTGKDQDEGDKLFDPCPTEGLLRGNFIRYLTFQDGFLLIVLSPHLGALRTNQQLLVWEVREEFQVFMPWKAHELPFTEKDFYFIDKDYLVVLNQENGHRSTFLVFSMVEMETEPGGSRSIATIEVDDADAVQYKNGFLVIASYKGDVRFIEVKSGRTLRTIQTELNFLAPGSLLRLSKTSELFYFCHASTRGTVFQLWNFNDVLNLDLPVVPLATFSAFTGQVVLDFKFDAFGIVAVMEGGGELGMQILSFLPQCSGCKRVTKIISLKRCSRCMRAKYCSRECQRDDWNHHKAICSKLAVE